MNRSFALPRIGLVALMATALMAVAALFIAANTASGAPSRTAATTNVAYLSFAVANSYDAPMLAAAKKVAAKGGAKVTVFDAANDPKKQLQQFQTAIAVESVPGDHRPADLRAAAAPDGQAGDPKAGIKVVNIDQILGTNPAHGCAAGARACPGTSCSSRRRSARSRASCSSPPARRPARARATVGYLYSVKASSLDAAIRKGVNSAIKGHNIKIVAEGETFYKPANALKAAQTMLQAHPDLNVIMGADQGATGAQQALKGNKNVTLIGYGGGGVGLARVKSGAVVRHGRPAAGDRGAAGHGVRAEGRQDRQGLRRHRRPRGPAQRRRRHEGERLQVQG